MNAVPDTAATWADCDEGHRPLAGSSSCAVCDPPVGWWKRAACAGQPTDLFYGGSVSDKIAVRLCAACPVRAYCLEEGWDDEHGLWGGLTAGQRNRIRSVMGLERVTRRQRRVAIRELASRPLNIPN